jgi:hypothetical protein
VVLSSHVLYGVEDAPTFLLAMDAAARRLCALCLGVVAPADALAALRERVHGAPLPRRPGAMDALALLDRIGLRPSLRVLPGTEREVTFGQGDDEIDEVCVRVNVEPDDAGRARVRAALAALGSLGADGLHHVGTSGPNALITWRARRSGTPTPAAAHSLRSRP